MLVHNFITHNILCERVLTKIVHLIMTLNFLLLLSLSENPMIDYWYLSY